MAVWKFACNALYGSGRNVQAAWEDCCADLHEDPGQAPQGAEMVEGDEEQVASDSANDAVGLINDMTRSQLDTLFRMYGISTADKTDDELRVSARLQVNIDVFSPESVKKVVDADLSHENLFKDAPKIEPGTVQSEAHLLLGTIAEQYADNLKKVRESGVLTGEEPPRRVAICVFMLTCEQNLPSGSFDDPQGEPAKFLAKLREVLS